MLSRLKTFLVTSSLVSGAYAATSYVYDATWELYRFPLNVINQDPGKLVPAAFVMSKFAVTVNKYLGIITYVPQEVLNLFINQNCSLSGTFDEHGYNGISAAAWYSCDPNKYLSSFFPDFSVAPGASWCDIVCDFQLLPNVAACFTNLSTQACNYVSELQKQEDNKVEIALGIVAGAALVTTVGIFACKKFCGKREVAESAAINNDSRTSYGTV